MATTTAKRPANRWPALLDAAAAQFAQLGYHATTIRDLATAAAMTPGAVYFFVPTKQALLLAVYEEGVQRILDHVAAAVVDEADPWARLEKAVRAHLEAVLDASAYARVVVRVLPGDVPDVADAITRMRDRYEERFRRLLADIALPPRHDATLARLFLLGAINWTPVWYRADGAHDLAAIARAALAPLRALAGADR